MSVMWSKAWVEERRAEYEARKVQVASDTLEVLRSFLKENGAPEPDQKKSLKQPQKLAIALVDQLESKFDQLVADRKQRMAEKRSQTKAREVLTAEGAGMIEPKQLAAIGGAVEEGLTTEYIVSRLVARVEVLEQRLAKVNDELLTRMVPSGVDQKIEVAFAARQTGELRLVTAKELEATLKAFASDASVTDLDSRIAELRDQIKGMAGKEGQDILLLKVQALENKAPEQARQVEELQRDIKKKLEEEEVERIFKDKIQSVLECQRRAIFGAFDKAIEEFPDQKVAGKFGRIVESVRSVLNIDLTGGGK